MPLMPWYVFCFQLMLPSLRGNRREGSQRCRIPQGLYIVLGDANWYYLCFLWLVLISDDRIG